MRYRWKVLFLLLAISLTPIIAMRAFGLKGVRHLSRYFVNEATNSMVQDTENRLNLLVYGHSSGLWEGREYVETVLKLQVREVERVFKEKMQGENIYFSADYTNNPTLTKKPYNWERYIRKCEDSDQPFVPISLDHQVFHIAPGIEADDVKEDLNHLSQMTSFYRQTYEEMDSHVLWMATTLESGVMGEYPGHAYIPENLDPRRLAWYRAASMDREIPWSFPYMDPATGQVVVAACLPVSDETGKRIGSTTIVSPAKKLVENPFLRENVPPRTRSFVCFLYSDKKDADEIYVLFRREYEDIIRGQWCERVLTETLTSSDKDQLNALKRDFEAGLSGSLRMPFEGEDCLWVYGPLYYRDSHFLIIVPYEEIYKPAILYEAAVEGSLKRFLQASGVGILLLMLIVIGLAFRFSQTVTKPIQALAMGAKRLSRGEFDTTVNITSSDEFGDMGKAFNRVGPRLKEHYRVMQSLAVATEVQRNLLPKTIPQIDGLDVAGTSIYCDETGGDYYDFLVSEEAPDHKLAMVVGDVSGHGIPSALLMATARALIRQRFSMPGDLAQVTMDVNRHLSADVGDSGEFMTVFLAEVNTATNLIRWVRAGHEPGMVYDPVADKFEELSGPGVALGFSRNSQYVESIRKLKPGQVLVIGTDGIWEAMNSKREMFSKKRFRELIRANHTDSAQTIVDAVISAVKRFIVPLDLKDDVTLLVIKLR